MVGLTFVVSYILHTLVAKGSVSNEGVCSAPTVLPPLCRDMPYNTTKFPNSLSQTLDGAGLQVHQFYPLIKVKCSNSIKFLLCTTYFPYCNPLLGTIPTCRHVCEDTKRGCEGLMNKFGFPWPDSLNCDKYPEKMDAANCLDMESTHFQPTTSTRTTTMSTAASTMTPTVKPPKRRRLINEGVCSAPTVLPPLCRDIPYNTTKFPNSLSQTSEDAALTVATFSPVIQVKCSNSFKFLVCSTFFPYCNPLLGTIPTCRHVCEDTKRGCEGLMNKFGFPWPDSLNCDKYPEKMDAANCLDMESTHFQPTTSTRTTTMSTAASTMTPTVKPPKRRRLMYRRLLTLLRDTARDVRDSMQSLYTALSP
ncbi:uncharacterized protein [Haliotis asinina]|uniref:uncharacterized protein n=1 Tax=Haliotis asinina TaxID=109174 RepID=UPI0035323B3E